MTYRSAWRDLNPLHIFQSHFSYHRIPPLSAESLHGAMQLTSERWLYNGVAWRDGRRRCGIGKLRTRSVTLLVALIVLLSLVAGGGYQHHTRPPHKPEKVAQDVPFYWMHFPRLNGYYNGIRSLVPASDVNPDNGYNQTRPRSYEWPSQEYMDQLKIQDGPPMDPVEYHPYPDYMSSGYLQDHHEVNTCYLDPDETIPPPSVYAYLGVQQHMPEPLYGDYKTLGLEDNVCWERFGRYGAYGYGHDPATGGLGPGRDSEKVGSEKIFEQGWINYHNTDWGSAQRRCHENNAHRFQPQSISNGNQKPVKREAFVLRTWTGYDYQPHQILAIRAMITELSLKSGGEYDVHLLLHVKDDSIPIWADQGLYQQVIQNNVPQEFWNITTLWSEQQMELYYPLPFPGNFANMAGSKLHGVYRSAHMPLQWFAQQHPEYDFFWNWEMDIRYQGHYYELTSKIGQWGKQQPRKGMWERSKRFYFPKYHGDWDNFTRFVEWETAAIDAPKNDEVKSGQIPVWGPMNSFPRDNMMPPPEGTTPPTTYDDDNYEWGVGEDADIMTFNPIFDPATTTWVFSWDISGFNTDLPPPPRRAAIITVARLSKRLLDTMHTEMWSMKHTMFPEMWPVTAALHHGLKALYIPHPVYFDRDWDLEYANQVFNYPVLDSDSPFAWGEHNLLGSSFYYNSGFSGALWRRWLGQRENGEGGRTHEEEGTGRLCLRPILHHPIKHESGPTN